jgi:hypothetical protein
MSQYSALYSVVYMMGFVLVFDRFHWRRKYSWKFWAPNLMSRRESEQILRILAASRES